MEGKHSFDQDSVAITLLSFCSFGRALLYAGRDKGIVDNWARARKYAKSNKMYPVQLTEGGLFLSFPNRFKTTGYSQSEAESIWRSASRRYCRSIVGDVRTFVSCAGLTSIFRKVEFHHLLRNPTIGTINGVSPDYFTAYRAAVFSRLCAQGLAPLSAGRKTRARVYRRMVFQELRSDLAQARQEQNPSKKRDVTVRLQAFRAFTHREIQGAQYPKNKIRESDMEFKQANPHLFGGAFVPGEFFIMSPGHPSPFRPVV